MQTFLEIVLSNSVLATVLAVFVAAIARVCRRPAVVHGLWLLVLLKLLTPPLVPVSFSWLSLESIPLPLRAGQAGSPAPESAPPDASFALKDGQAEPAGPTSVLQYVWVLGGDEAAPTRQPVTAGLPGNLAELVHAWVLPWMGEVGVPIWLGVSLLWFACTLHNSYRFQRLLRFARRAPASLQEQARTLAARMGLKECPGVWLLPGAVSPMLWSMGGKPRLLFPKKLLDHLDREQRATLLVHELAHYRRGDHWLRFVEMLVVGLFWWHPVVWWARHELHEAEEHCCDAWVVWTLAGADRAYATALLQTVAFVSQSPCPLPAAASGIGQVRHLRRRLTMIMQGKTPRSLSWAGFLAIVGLGVLLLPVQAQSPRSETEQEIAKLKQELRALEQKLRSEQDDTKKASAEEIAAAKEQVAAFARDAEAKRKVFEEAMQRHHKAMAHLATLEGKKTFTITAGQPKVLWLEDGKTNKQPHVIRSEVKMVPGEKGGKEEKRIILHVRPDEKYDAVQGKILDLQKDGYRIEVQPGGKVQKGDTWYYTVPKQDAKPGTKTEEQRIWQYKIAAPDTKPEKPGEKAFRYELKGIPEVTPGELKTYRYEFQNRPGEKSAPKASPSDRAGDLEKKIDRLQKEIEELKDALKRSRSQLPAISSGSSAAR